MGERNSTCRVLVGKPEGRGPLIRPRCIWDDNIKMALRELELEHGYKQVAGCCECGNELSGSIKCGEFLD